LFAGVAVQNHEEKREPVAAQREKKKKNTFASHAVLNHMERRERVATRSEKRKKKLVHV
jgi:hypothetical protein